MIDVAEHDLQTILSLLDKYVPECEVRAFGSRATWTAKEHSDLDLVIVGPEKIERKRIWQLKDALEESSLPFVVDLMDWNRISPEFQKNIEKSFAVIKKPAAKTGNEWKYYKVSEFAEVIGGGTPKTEVSEYWNGKIPWITPKDLSNHKERRIARGERNITEEGLRNSGARLVPANTILLTSRAPVGYLAIAQNELTTNQGFRNLVVRDNFSSDFVYYLLLNNVEYLKQHASGSTFQEISGGTLKNLQFQIPDSATQQVIAKILSDLDDKIELNHKMNKTLESIALALFKKWFVEFEFPGYEKTKFIDGLPEGWREGKLGEIIVNYDSKRVPLANREREKRGGEYPYYGAASIVDYVNDFLFDGVYVLMGEDGSVITDQGAPVLQYVWGKFWVNNHAHVLKGANGIATEYILLQLQQTNIKHIVTGAVQPKINQQNMNRLPVIIPTSDVVSSFSKDIAPMYDAYRNNIEESKLLTNIRDSLLPRLMSGKIRVKNA